MTAEERTTAEAALPVPAGNGDRSTPRRSGGGGRRRGRRGGGERRMVPDATFTSYYGRPVVKASPWEKDIPAYLFLGGLSAGSALLGAGADLTDRPVLRRAGRLGALGAITVSFAALVHDLGRPMRFINMLRVAKPTSPMSVGTWILTAYSGPVAIAAAGELRSLVPARLAWADRLIGVLARPAGLVAAVIAPAVASYTAVLLGDTATPTWHAAHRELPFVFVGSASAAGAGLGLIAAPVCEAGPARRLAAGGALLDLAVAQWMEGTMGITAEPLHQGSAGRLMRASKTFTALGALGAVTVARRSRVGAALSGTALLAGSVCTRFGIFEAGQASARDPRYTVVPQRERVENQRRLGGEFPGHRPIDEPAEKTS